MRVTRIAQRMSLKQRLPKTKALLKDMANMDMLKRQAFIAGFQQGTDRIVNAASGLTYEG